jgi:hypothetical protein
MARSFTDYQSECGCAVTDAEDQARLIETRRQFNRYILDGIPQLRRLGYNPTQFLEMVERYNDVVGATKRLLADPRHTSYGFQRLYDMRRLQDSVEFAVCLPWFAELFDPQEITEACTRLITHEFPLDARLASTASSPPGWVSDL